MGDRFLLVQILGMLFKFSFSSFWLAEMNFRVFSPDLLYFNSLFQKVDEFIVQSVTLGRLSSLRVWLNPESSGSWHLEWIQICEEESLHNGTVSPPNSATARQPPTLFYAGQWLDTAGDSRDIELTPLLHPVGCLFGPSQESDFATPQKISKMVSGICGNLY